MRYFHVLYYILWFIFNKKIVEKMIDYKKISLNDGYYEELSFMKNHNETMRLDQIRDYNRYYHLTPWWQRLRKKKLDSVGHKCEKCESKEYLQTHHRPGHYFYFHEILIDLEILCRSCHSRFHKVLR